MQWQTAPDISRRIHFLIRELGFSFPPDRIFCFRSRGSTGRVIARIWSLPKIWQQGFSTKAKKDESKATAEYGLHFCKHIIESIHKGMIAVESAVGKKGTKFIIRLPLADENS